MQSSREKLRNLLAERSLLAGPVVLSNGRQSSYYFDCKRVTLSPDGASLVADVLLEALDGLSEQPAAIGGFTHGAEPILGAVMMRAHERGRTFQTFYVRKEPKKLGAVRWIENPPPPGSKVVIIDDVVATGKAVIQAIDQVERHNCQVIGGFCLVDREEGGGDAIRERCPSFRGIFRKSDFPEAARLSRSGAETLTDEIRSSLSKGFYSNNLRHVLNLIAEARKSGQAGNPVVLYTVGSILSDAYRRWFDDEPVTVQTSETLEDRVIPAVDAVLNAGDGRPEDLIARLNDLVRAYWSCLP